MTERVVQSVDGHPKFSLARRHEEENRITVAELMERLSEYAPDTEITFGSLLDCTPLQFYRVKRRGEDLVQVELNELHPECF